VGKTTVSAAFAVRAALRERRGRVLLVSTDPAHSLADILQMRLGDEPRRVKLPGSGHLYAWQINSQNLFAKFLSKYKDDILNLIDKGSIFSRQDIEPLLDTTLPGMAEMSALLGIHDAIGSQKYSRIVVDTAPFGHTLRLFSLPEQFVRFLNFLELAAARDQVLAAHFGGKRRAGTADPVAHFRKMVQEIQDATSNKAELVLVATGEQFSLNESVRCSSAVQEQSPPLRFASIVLNRVKVAKGCSDCERSRIATQEARTFLAMYFPRIPIRLGEDPGGPILGATALAGFGEHVFSGKRLKYGLRPPATRPARLRETTWPVLDKRLCLVAGKGGVGKTTTSAALAFHARRKSRTAVEICSVDPAPSLADIFDARIGPESQPIFGDSKLRASELDAVALFRDWVSDLRSSVEDATTSEVSGIHIDLSFERQLLSELLEIIPPGVDEVLAIFRIFDLVGGGATRIVIDMAPTGHALELLRMPERILVWSRLLLKTLAAHRTLAFARDAAAKIAEMSVRVRELAALLTDSDSTEMNVVMLPEPLPDRETERLIAEIKVQKLPLRRIFLNRVLLDEATKCRRCARARQWQEATLAAMKQRHQDLELFVIRNFPNEIVGKEALQSFTGELWRLA
jgi:arsenite/tail-anchored protein-transporting ATPase